MGFLKKALKKVTRSASKHLRNLPKSLAGPVKGGKASIFNPVTHGLFSAKKLYKGSKGSVKSKVTRALGVKQSNSVPYQYTIGGDSGSCYVHNARTLSQLTGGR